MHAGGQVDGQLSSGQVAGGLCVHGLDMCDQVSEQRAGSAPSNMDGSLVWGLVTVFLCPVTRAHVDVGQLGRRMLHAPSPVSHHQRRCR